TFNAIQCQVFRYFTVYVYTHTHRHTRTHSLFCDLVREHISPEVTLKKFSQTGGQGGHLLRVKVLLREREREGGRERERERERERGEGEGGGERQVRSA